MKHHTFKAQKRYTSIRRFYAWTGFIFWLVATPAILALLVWSNSVLLAHGLLP